MEAVHEEIVNVGGGIAGLTTSLGLHRLGIRSLMLLASVTSLRGNHQRLYANVTSSTISGIQTSETSFEAKGKRTGDHEIRCVQRKLLLETLGNELPSGTIRYSSKVVSIEDRASISFCILLMEPFSKPRC
ncbi:hypothetical protein SLA2020_434570 [Shorea laevis]